jgi:transcriptional regulator with XRE-family HTH domain
MGACPATEPGSRRTILYGQKPGYECMGTLGNYLRVRRRQSLLSQKELAFLFGYKNESFVSRLERHDRGMTFGTSRACRIIFGSRTKDIFPALSKEHDDKLLQRMQELCATLEQHSPSTRREVKLQLLRAAIDRLGEAEVDGAAV